MIDKISIQEKINNNVQLDKDDIIFLLKLLQSKEKDWLYNLADRVREEYMGGEVYIRGIIEFSNYCRKSCDYCGIRSLNKKVERYRMNEDEIIKVCKKIEQYGWTTVVLQSGEDFYYTKEKIGALLKRIKKETSLAITLSLGERSRGVYDYWYQCGMDRYLLRFETSNKQVFKKLHPDDDYNGRLQCIKNLKKSSVQTGSGFLIGLPGTDIEDIARDILLCYQLDLDMIGIGPFISHPDTPLKNLKKQFNIDFLSGVISILRLVNKDAHIPATTAYDAVHPNGRLLALRRGANVFMPNATPSRYRSHYLLYPNKPCVDKDSEEYAHYVESQIQALGRTVGKGPGHSIHGKVER